ncbi:hypothetical protein VNO80_09865 [Phaseolus coccineus]|uniref:Uncharacterized protein n=1 Tax=Phaseolus coccineus TaxID=3886 RepID=A0AAN9N7M3_PHACN
MVDGWWSPLNIIAKTQTTKNTNVAPRNIHKISIALNNPNQHKISKPNSQFHSNKNNNTLERIKSIHTSFIETVLNEQNIPKFIY